MFLRITEMTIQRISRLYDENKKEWHLSHAYDLIYSSSFNGEHATTINGEGKTQV